MRNIFKTTRVGVIIDKHSPEILLVGGLALMVMGTVLACKNTTRLSEITEKTKNDLKLIHDAKETQTVETIENGVVSIEYNDTDYRKDLATTYAKTAVNVTKLYAPSIICFGLGTAGILASHGIMSKRNAALGAAYLGLSEQFKSYRDKVRTELGKDADRHFRFDTEQMKIEEIVKNESSGKEETKETIVENVNRGKIMPSDYAKFFDSTCNGWDPDPYYTMTFLKQQQKFCNDLLRGRGHLFLNEVYDILGINRTPTGQFVGWVYNTENPVGDNYVDFGLYDVESEAMRRFVNGLEDVVLLDFNVDGPIYNLL